MRGPPSTPTPHTSYLAPSAGEYKYFQHPPESLKTEKCETFHKNVFFPDLPTLLGLFLKENDIVQIIFKNSRKSHHKKGIRTKGLHCYFPTWASVEKRGSRESVMEGASLIHNTPHLKR